MGFIVMFDITSEQSFSSIRPWLDQLRIHSSFENPDMVLCGNKADLEHRRVISWSRANQEAIKHGIPYFETSSATGLNVSKAIETLLDLVIIRMHKVIELNIPKMLHHSSFKLNQNNNHDDNNSTRTLNSSSSQSSRYCSCR